MYDEIKVSVIIPVYNASKHLVECLDTVVSQTLEEIEIICVDDGSTDDSISILKKYENKYDNFRVLQQKNLFAGVARNNGMKVANGKYLMFWDSDDFFELNTLEVMYDRITSDNADICVCGGFNYYDDIDKEYKVDFYLNTKRLPDTIPFNINQHNDLILNFTAAHPWNKMFRASFIAEKGLEFQDSRNGNDIFFVTCALCLAERITVVKKNLIHYRLNQSDSLVGSVIKSPLVPPKNWINTHDYLIEHNCFPEKSFTNRVIGSLVSMIRNLNDWEALKITLHFLQEDGLEALGLCERPVEFYLFPWYKDFVNHLTNDTPEQFILFLSNLNNTQRISATMERGARNIIIKSQGKTISKQEKTINKQEKTINKQEKTISKLEKTINKKEKTISKLEKEISRLETKITSILNSKSYRLATYIRKIVSRFTPHKSRK